MMVSAGFLDKITHKTSMANGEIPATLTPAAPQNRPKRWPHSSGTTQTLAEGLGREG